MRDILCIGAHPDDNEICVGGTAALWRSRGDRVCFVSVTNGDRGHFDPEYANNRQLLAERREAEARASAAIVGIEYRTLGVHDGEVYVTPENTEAMVRCIRSFGEPGKGPDLVVFNRLQDYHRDHRYTAQLVVDATYMLTVPFLCPETRHLDRMPVFACWHDGFRDIVPFRTDVAVQIGGAMETKIDMLCEHVSQVFEWLPYNGGTLDSVPPAEDTASRRDLISRQLRHRDSSRSQSVSQEDPAFAALAGNCVEAFQLCEYGRRPTLEDLLSLFPSSATVSSRLAR